ncbi:unnamed protein product [Toxocara canis]|uniref:Phosphoinositide phospholipase C n=1 Tax=Toxocara canis TaxID=6265 RepID=A0A183UR91_TOXCA|nr:unnamed protein product [Toxocara canis]
MKENRDSNVINRVTFSIGQDKDSSRAGRMGGNGTATSRSMLIGSTNCLTETSGRVARLQTTSFSFREVKDRLLTKNNLNFKRASSARTDYLSDQTASHNPDNCSTPVVVKVNDVLLLKQGNGKSEEAKTWAATVEAKTSNEAACRSHSFSLKRITNKLFSKCATSHEHKATPPSSERQLLDHDDQHMEEVDNVDKPPVMSLPHEYALIDSADEILPQMRPKSRSWSHADVAVKIRRSASTRSATIAVRSDLSVNSTAIASHRNADKLAQKKPFLKRFLLLTRECAAEDGASGSTLLQGSPSHGDGFEEALTGMRPKSKSFSNTSEISRPKRNFTRQCSSEASVNVIPQCNKEDLVDTAARSQCPIAALRIPRSASCIFPCCTPKLKRRRKTLSACCSPLYLPTQIRFSLPDAAATEPLSREFATLLNELRHKRHSPRLGITRNVVKTFFRRVFVRKTAR